MKYIIALITLFSFQLEASTQKILGSYAPDQMRAVKVGCMGSTLNSVILVPETSNSCTHSFNIKSFTIHYQNGMDQEFEYPTSAPLKTTRFDILPGNKCLSHISANISRVNSKNCENNKVKIVLAI